MNFGNPQQPFDKQPPPGMKMTVDPTQMPTEKCSNCGNIVWEQGIIIKKISALISPDGKEHTGSIPVLTCKKCGSFHPESQKIVDMGKDDEKPKIVETPK